MVSFVSGRLSEVADPEELKKLYLERLRRLLRLLSSNEFDLNEAGFRLLKRSIFATFCDLRDLDCEEAKEILAEVPEEFLRKAS